MKIKGKMQVQCEECGCWEKPTNIYRLEDRVVCGDCYEKLKDQKPDDTDCIAEEDYELSV